MSGVVSYKCPNCAAGLSFDIEQQNWHCQFCLSDFSLNQLQAQQPDGAAGDTGAESARDAEPVMDEMTVEQAAPEQFGGDAAAFSCPSCGGHIVTDKNTAATFCVFCHNPTVLSSRLEDEYRPAQLIPFKLEKPAVLEALRGLCRKRPLLPANFRGYAEKGEVSGLYVPFWLFDADIDAALSGTGRRITKWSDSNYRYTKTDTYRVERRAKFKFRGVPADASQKMDDRLMDSLEPFDYNQMVGFNMGYLSGHFAESYDVDAAEASKRAMPRMRQGVERMLRADVKGYTTTTVQSLHATPKRTSNTYVMLPVWVLMAEYGGKRYTFAMNGQTGKITGSLPICKRRLLTLFGAVAGGVAALCFLGGMLL